MVSYDRKNDKHITLYEIYFYDALPQFQYENHDFYNFMIEKWIYGHKKPSPTNNIGCMKLFINL